jgi:hypothetical protein
MVGRWVGSGMPEVITSPISPSAWTVVMEIMGGVFSLEMAMMMMTEEYVVIGGERGEWLALSQRVSPIVNTLYCNFAA